MGKWLGTIPSRRNERTKEKASGYNKSSLTSRWQEKVFFFGKVRPDENPNSTRALPWVSIWLMLESVYLPSSYNNTLVGEFSLYLSSECQDKDSMWCLIFRRWDLCEPSLSWTNRTKRPFHCANINAVVAHLTGFCIQSEVFLFETHSHTNTHTHNSQEGVTPVTQWALSALTAKRTYSAACWSIWIHL